MKKLVVGISAEGSVNLLRGQMRYFKDRGYQTFLIAPYSQRSAAFCAREGCVHLVVPIQREISVWSDLINLFRILRIFWQIKPDVINLGTPKVSLLGMIAGKILGIKNRIYTCRGFRYEHERGAKRKVLMMMEKITAWCSHTVVCISTSVRELGIRDGIFPDRKSLVIHKGSSNGVDLELFNRELISAASTDQLREELGLRGKFVFGFIGRIVDRKGIRQLYEAFDQLWKKYPEMRLLLVGPFENSQITDKTLVTDIQSHGAILYVGRKPQEDVPLYLTLVDVFVLPAWWEGFGNVLVQAAAMRIPVISTTATGTCDAVAPNYNGILVKPKDTLELKGAMLTLYQNDRLREEYGLNGIDWARNFNRTIIWEGLEKIYEGHTVRQAV